MNLNLKVYQTPQGYPLRVTQIVDGVERQVDGIERISMTSVHNRSRVFVRAIAEVEVVTVEPPERG